MSDDLSTFRDVDDGMDEDDSEAEEDETDQPMLPVGAADAVCPRRISLSSLWQCASVISPAETDDLSICHRASSSGCSAPSASQCRVPLGSDSYSPTPSAVSPPRNISLDMVFPTTRDLILTWHPNRVFFAIIQVLHQRLTQSLPVRRRCRGKQSDPMETLQNWMAARFVTTSRKVSARHRGAGRDMYRRILSILTGSSIRAVVKATGRLWEELGIENKNSWGQLAELVKRREVQNCAQEFLAGSSSANRLRTLQARQAQVGDVDTSTCRGYGVSLCLNTSLGQDDVQVIRILQSGLSGQELLTALAEVACYSEFMDACWAYFELLGKENGFPLVACGLEHSANGSHPARVHVHVYMGIEVRGAFFPNNAAMGSIALEKLIWHGIKPGFVRPTMVARRTNAYIQKAVIQAYYYVAGPKKTQMLLRCSAEVHKEHGQPAGNTLHISRTCSTHFVQS